MMLDLCAEVGKKLEETQEQKETYSSDRGSWCLIMSIRIEIS